MYHTMCYMFIYRYWFKGSFSLMISMGVTWIFGLLSLHKFLLPFIYLFAIFTSLQVSVLGFYMCYTCVLQGLWIFLLFVVLSHPVRYLVSLDKYCIAFVLHYRYASLAKRCGILLLGQPSVPKSLPTASGEALLVQVPSCQPVPIRSYL